MKTLEDARHWLAERLTDGAHCPVCQQHAKIYRRKINSGMARALIAQYRTVGQEAAHTSRLAPWTHEAAQLSWWGLLEQEADAVRPDLGRSGWWRVTDLGRAFVTRDVTVPKFARIYDGRLLELEYAERISITEAVGSRFSYADLMGLTAA